MKSNAVQGRSAHRHAASGASQATAAPPQTTARSARVSRASRPSSIVPLRFTIVSLTSAVIDADTVPRPPVTRMSEF